MARDFFVRQPKVDTVLLVNSCARGQAVAESDLDMAVLVTAGASAGEVQGLEQSWARHMAAQPMIEQFRRAGRFSQVHLDVIDGRFTPAVWDDGGGPDSFEVEIGNRVAYALPMGGAGPRFRELQTEWLPYYSDELRLRRLAMARDACAYDLDHIPMFAARGLHFQAFDRLYKAFQEFLQAVFITRKTYPIAYNKWIREQVAERLGSLELYRELSPVLSIRNIESSELAQHADALKGLLQTWVRP